MSNKTVLNSKVNSVDNLVLNGVLTAVPAGTWTGTMTQLSSDLIKVYNKDKKVISNLPGSPSALRVVLNRIANRLRTRGVSVKFGRTNDSTRTRFVKLSK